MKNQGLMASVLVILAFALCAGLVSAPPAAATSECLGLPTDAANDWKDFYPCCYDDETCEDACENWIRTCNDFARIAFECQYHSSREFIALFKGSECDTETDKSSRKSCSKDAASELRSIKDDLSDDLREAKELCIDCYSDCLDFCEDD